MTELDRCCEKCRYYEPERRECRRYPPQLWCATESNGDASYGEAFPQVSKDQWCGEFMGKPGGIAYVQVCY